MADRLTVRNAREHNLRGISLDLPRDSLVVITGVSGSGKSSLAFDTIYQEGQRRFMESLSPYARQFLGQMERPKVDRVEGLSPTLSIDQKTVNRNPRSTVGTVTEVYDHLRLLFARLGTPHCPKCDRTISRQSPGELADRWLRDHAGERILVLAPMVRDRKGEYREEWDHWRKEGWLRARVDGEVRLIEEPLEIARYEKHTLELVVDRLVCLTQDRARLVESIERALRLAEGVVCLLVPAHGDKPEQHSVHAVDRACPEHGISVSELEPRLFSFNAPQGACPTCTGIGEVVTVRGLTMPAPSDSDPAARRTCPDCSGRRLNPVALAVEFRGQHIDEAARMSVRDANVFFSSVVLEGSEILLGEGIVKEIRDRMRFLDQVGLGYLTLDRRANTLSGGEAQRIRLAACVGSGLQGVTYVLDEPSIGLHPRDNRRLLGALGVLRDQGNTLLIVEHDRETMEMADHLVDIGPGAGILGGWLMGSGPPGSFLTVDSPTARYLRGEEVIPMPLRLRTATTVGRGELQIKGARMHNLRGQAVKIPLGCLTVLTGVSGSGKSTLMFDVLQAHLEGRATEACGVLTTTGLMPDKVIEIAQTPIGRTPRSNPGTYSGTWDLIRDLYAELPESRARGYKKGQFSFNVAGGRCDTCEGAGVRTIAMHFLADVEIPCETCNSRRFNAQTLEILYRGKSIADVLEMQIAEAVEFWSNNPKIHRILSTLHQVGLGYITLGQRATTLSGGEAQRLKLATELQRPATGNTVYLLDEPTTGLHFSDVRVLIGALQLLVDAGNTMVVIEHNTDVVKVADHLIEVGPEGGVAGGHILAMGPPAKVARTDTPTGIVLRALPEFGGQPVGFAAERPGPARLAPSHDLVIRGARCHNLRGVNVTIPRGRMTVITGPSGSGKTSLAFDTIFAEGQRRYVESLSTYARRFLGRLERAPIDSISGLAPAIAIDQRTSGGSGRSTVATVTELQDHFRLLWANLGVPHCPTCDRVIHARPPVQAAEYIASATPGPGWLLCALSEPQPAADLRKAGFARGYDGRKGDYELTDQPKVTTLVLDRLDPATVERSRLVEAITTAYRYGANRAWFQPRGAGRGAHPDPLPVSALARCPEHGLVHKSLLTPRHFSFNHYLGACTTCDGMGRIEIKGQIWLCKKCSGSRLKPEIMAVRFGGGRSAPAGLHTVSACTVSEARGWFDGLELAPNDALVAAQPLREIRARLRFLEDVGVGYLNLDRGGNTVSGGEAQRIRLATQLGGGLTGVIYVLDEPTVGLHPRDTARLLGTLEGLRALDNTLVIVEHDPETIRRADHVIDLGPEAGERGGQVLAEGPPMSLPSSSATGPWLRGERTIPLPAFRRPGGPPIQIRKANRHSLVNVDVDIPTGAFTVVTGVSGSGKSTLILDLMVGKLTGDVRPVEVTIPQPDPRTVLQLQVIDQTPIGRSPRSSAATYVGVMDPLRKLFAQTPVARERGWSHSYFTANGGEGACSVCKGYGSEQVEMHFLSNVWVKCETCHGRRFAPETLDARWKGLSIADVLDLRVDDAIEIFAQHRAIRRALEGLNAVGLGYVRLGQPATDLSGGEAQRVKLALGLADRSNPTIYVLDEPTTGLHLSDIARLVTVLDRLVDHGHTVIVVEHHVDIMRHADLLIDMGPEAGPGGGRIVVTGTPEEVARHPTSHTAAALRASGL